jgi:hypothetical protein
MRGCTPLKLRVWRLLAISSLSAAPVKFSAPAGRPRKPKRAQVQRKLMPDHVFREIEEHPLEPWLANEGEAELS